MRWLGLVDLIWETKGVLSALYLVGWMGLLLIRRDFRTLSESLFRKSVDFLPLFDRMGSNYVVSSVVICVVLPLLVYGALIGALFWG